MKKVQNKEEKKDGKTRREGGKGGVFCTIHARAMHREEVANKKRKRGADK